MGAEGPPPAVRACVAWGRRACVESAPGWHLICGRLGSDDAELAGPPPGLVSCRIGSPGAQDWGQALTPDPVILPSRCPFPHCPPLLRHLCSCSGPLQVT